jgi:hypothetical protein
MAINWDEVRKKANDRGKTAEQQIKAIQRPAVPAYTPPKTEQVLERKLPTAVQSRRGNLPKAKPINVLNEAFDKNENYIDKAKKGNVGGAVANFIGTGLTGAQTLYLNAANSADSLAQGKGLPKYQPQMSFTDYDKAVAERRGAKPTIEQVSKVNPVLGGAYQLVGEIGTDPLELLPGGMVNDIKLARGTAQNSAAYMNALQSGKLNPAVTLPRANTPAPLPRATQTTPQNIPVQAPSVTVQPRNPEKGIEIPKEQPFAQNGDFPKTGKVEAKFRDLGADANRFEEVAMVTTDSDKLKPSLKDATSGLVSNLKRKFVDSGDTVAKISKINNDKGLYNLYNNAKQSRKRAEYHIGEAQTDLAGNKVGKSLKEIFDPIRKKGKAYYEDFQEYMYHLHNIDRMGFGDKAMQKLREFEIQHQDLANLEDKQLREILKTADSDSAAVVKEYMKLIDDVNNAPSKPVFGKSITADESKKVSEYLLQQHPEFAQEAADVRKYLDNMMQYRIQSGLVSEDSAKALAEMYKNYVPTYRVNPSMRGLKTFGGAANISTGIKKATGSSKDLLPLHEQIARQTIQTVEAAHKNLFGARLAQNINPNTQQFVQELKKVDDAFDIDAEVLPELKNTFNVYENGQAYQMKVDDSLYEGIKALAGTDPNELVKAATAANRGFKELITSWNPMFLIRNVARDIQDVGLYSKNLKGFAKMYPGAVKEIATNGDVWKQYKALGGAGNSFFDYSKGYKKDPSWLKRNTLDRIEQLNMSTEQLPRFAEYLATLDKLGHAPNYDELMQAMYNAADVTVNFGRSGTWGKTLNSTFVPFFNPAMQGTSKLIRKFTETKGVKGWTELVLKASALGVAPSLINEMVYHDDPQYAMINDREKDINFIIKIGDGEWLKFPKGRVLSLFGSGAQRLYRAAQGDEDAFAGYIKTMGDQVAPISPLESNILSPVMAVKNNKSWYGGSIEPEGLTGRFPSDKYQWKRYDERTSGIAKVMGEKLNYSPKKIDYLLDAYSGVIGDFVIPLSTPRAETNPFVKAFVVDSVTSNKIGQQFYDKKDEIFSARNASEGEDKYDVLNRYMNKQNEMVSELYDEIRKIENVNGPDQLKRQKVREVRALINGIQQTALDALPEVEKTTENLSRAYKDPEDLYREVNKKVFGAKYALQAYDKNLYEKAVASQIGFDTFYDAYFAQKDYDSNIIKAFAISDKLKNPTNKVYTAFNISEEAVQNVNNLKNAGVSAKQLEDSYLKTKDMEGDKYTNSKGNEASISAGSTAERRGFGKSASLKKKEAIDSVVSDPWRREALYKAFGVSEKVW